MPTTSVSKRFRLLKAMGLRPFSEKNMPWACLRNSVCSSPP